MVGDLNDNARYTFGIDPERTRSGAANLIVYNGYLYIGEYNDEEIAMERILFNKTGEDTSGSMGGVDCSFVNANLEQSVGLYRMNQSEDMELVVGDATKMFPNGGISGLGTGFGHNENQYIWRMQEYGGKLYVGTFDTSSLLEPIGQFSNGNIINMTPEEWATQLLLLYDREKLCVVVISADWDDAERIAEHLEIVETSVDAPQPDLTNGRGFRWIGGVG